MRLLRRTLGNTKCGRRSTIHLTTRDHWVTSGGLGTMGFGFPAAIGAQLAKPEARVVAIVGDAGFQMTLQELSLATRTSHSSESRYFK